MRPAALFDVDKTLVNVNTARLYMRWRMSRKEASLRDYARMSRVLFKYAFGLLDPHDAARRGFRTLAGYEESRMRDECQTWYHKVVQPHISERGRREVARFRDAGYVCAILSASMPYLTEPLAAELGIPHVICTRLEVVEGKFTGAWQEPLCYGEGKLSRALAFAREHSVDLARSTFFTDSISDLPVLEAVGSPRVVNPDPRLFWVALKRGYPMETWR